MGEREYTVSDKVKEQRAQASRKHGVYSIRDQGQAAMDAPQRGMYAELQDRLSDRAGIVDVLKEQAANSVIICRVATDYIARQRKLGVDLDEIPLLRAIPAFQNSAARLLAQLLAASPNDQAVLDIGAEISKAVEEYESDS